MQWLATVQDPKVLGEVGTELVSQLAHSDLEKAKSFALALPAEAQPEAIHNLVRSWASEQSAQAGHWINSLPEGKTRDSAIKAYVDVIDSTDAGLATKWARSIQDPEERAEAFLDSFDRWRRDDRSAADAWLGENPLPDDPLRPAIEMVLRKSDPQNR